MSHDVFAEWHFNDAAFPSKGSESDKLHFMLRYATLAPSSHNTQPWQFRVADGNLDLIADRTRSLPVVDPNDRALIISCGAALGLLRVAMRFHGYTGAFVLLPEFSEPDILARVELGSSHTPDEADIRRFQAIKQRLSTRAPYADRPVPPDLIQKLKASAREDGVELAILTRPGVKASVAEIVAEGDQTQFADWRFRHELGSWVH